MAQQRLILFCDIDGTLVHYPDDAGAIAGTGPQDGTFTYHMPQVGACTPGLVRVPTNTPPGWRRHGAAPAPVHHWPAGMTACVTHAHHALCQGVISLRTLDLLRQWRSLGHFLVIISGARTSTVLQRLPYLPQVSVVY